MTLYGFSPDNNTKSLILSNVNINTIDLYSDYLILFDDYDTS